MFFAGPIRSPNHQILIALPKRDRRRSNKPVKKSKPAETTSPEPSLIVQHLHGGLNFIRSLQKADTSKARAKKQTGEKGRKRNMDKLWKKFMKIVRFEERRMKRAVAVRGSHKQQYQDKKQHRKRAAAIGHQFPL